MRWLALLLLLLPAFARAGIFDREHPEVAAGNEAYAAGRFEEALARYEAAARKLPDRSEVHHNRGNALYRLERWAEAEEAFLEALARRSDEAGAAADYFHLGNAQARQGKIEEAIGSFQRALRIDPAAEGARRNLERLLRRRQQDQQQQQDPQQDDAPGEGESPKSPESNEEGSPEGGESQQEESPPETGEQQPPEPGQEGSGGEDQQPDAGESEAEPQPGDEGRQQQAGGEQSPEEPQQPGGAVAGEAGEQEPTRSDAMRLLDSLQESERNFQLWRYQKDANEKGKADVDKEW